MRLLLLVLVALPLLAISDPGAGGTDRSTRNAARVSVWQAEYANMTTAQIRNKAYAGLTDSIDEDCLRDTARIITGTPNGTNAQATAWIKSKLAALKSTERVNHLLETCGPSSKPFTPEPLNQGNIIEKTLVVRGTTVSDDIRSTLPFLPRIGSIPGVVWGEMSRGTCTIGSVTGPCYATRHHWHEAQLDLLEAIVRAEGKLSNFKLVDNLSEVGWVVPTS